MSLGSIPQQAGRIEFDASGLMVAPGFINIHSHSDWLLLEDGGAESKVRHGVTTEVLGQEATPMSHVKTVRIQDHFQELRDP